MPAPSAEAAVATAAGPHRSQQARWFWRFWAAATVSRAGDAVTLVALPLVAVLDLGATSFEVGLLTAAGFVAWIAIGLPAGVIVHRLPLRGVQVAMDLVRAVALLSVPVAVALDGLTLAQLVGVAMAVGFASVVFDVGNATFLPSIIAADELVARNSQVSGADSAVQLTGPALGGVLVQVAGASTSLLVDAASYLVSAVLLRTLPRPAPAHAEVGGPSTAAMIRAGWRFVADHEVIRPCVVAATLVNFVCGGLMALTPVFLVRTLGASPGLVGLVIASEGLGSLLGAALTTRLAARLGTARTFLWAATLGAATAVLMPLAGAGWGLLLFVAGNAGFAGGVVVISILARAHRQTVTPRDLLPRVMATVRFVSWGVIPLGALTAGLVASALGNRVALWLLAAVALTTPVALWLSPLRGRVALEP